MNNITSIVLAAGKGTRIELGDNTPKCTRVIGGKPMITYTIDLLEQLKVAKIIVVIAPDDTHIKNILGDRVTYVTQHNPNGNAHAALQAQKQVKTKYVHIVQADDSAFYSVDTLSDFIKSAIKSKSVFSCITADKPETKNLGRIIRDSKGNFLKIVEKEDLTKDQAKITEINCGMYFGKTEWVFSAIKNLKPSNVGKGEIVLPDLIKSAIEQKQKITAYKLKNPQEFLGVNDIREWKRADSKMWLKTQKLPIIFEDYKKLNLKKPVIFWDLDETLICTDSLMTEILHKVKEISGGAIGNNRSVINRFDTAYFDYRLFIDYIAFKTGLKSAFVASELNNVVKRSNEFVIKETSKILEDTGYNHIMLTNGDNYLQDLKFKHSGLKKYFKRAYFMQVNKDFLFYSGLIESEILNADDVVVVNDYDRENKAFTSLLPNATLFKSEDIIEGKLKVG